MPLVLATGAPTASGHSYHDVLGKQYEFPLQYQNLVVPGEAFAYYMGRRGAVGGQPVYFGSGVVGDVAPSARAGQLIAQVHDVEIFDTPIPAKSASGDYLETGSSKQTNWTSGVRRINDEAMARIVGFAPVPTASQTSPAGDGGGHATHEHATALERYSVEAALTSLCQEFGADSVTEMPPANPGFDILVSQPGDDLHVEVKATVLPNPVFHLSEGQRKHADARGEKFRLMAFYQVDRSVGTHELVVLEGPLDATKVDLQTEAWTGRILL